MRYAVRSLLRSPRTTAAVITTLSVCVGAVAAMYSVVEAVLIRGLPFERPERLVWVASVSQDRPDRPFTLPEFIDYRAQSRSIRLAAYANWSAIVDREGGAQRLQGMRMSGDGLVVLGATPSAGRLL